jgi:hypothetical protein
MRKWRVFNRKGCVLHLPQSFQGYEAYEQVPDIMQGLPETFWLEDFQDFC